MKQHNNYNKNFQISIHISRRKGGCTSEQKFSFSPIKTITLCNISKHQIYNSISGKILVTAEKC